MSLTLVLYDIRHISIPDVLRHTISYLAILPVLLPTLPMGYVPIAVVCSFGNSYFWPKAGEHLPIETEPKVLDSLILVR